MAINFIYWFESGRPWTILMHLSEETERKNESLEFSWILECDVM
jgi:hypothetical protein